MITHLGHRIMKLLSPLRSRALLMAATSICLCLFNANASAQSVRRYPMTMHASLEPTGAPVDIPMFTKGVFADQEQPPGRSIAWLSPKITDLDQYGIDWSRIVAVYIDEPFVEFIPDSLSCANSEIGKTKEKLVEISNAMRARAPTARFWVNLTEKETRAHLTNAGCSLNESYIDVISMDVYWIDFEPYVRNLYADMYARRPTAYQQLALVVPAFTGGTATYNPLPLPRPPQTPAQGVARLTQYLNYAASMNQTCDLPLGLAGDTGFYDKCPVWMVTGFIGGILPLRDDPSLLPIDNPNSAPVLDAWKEKAAIQRIDPTQVPKALKLIPSLFIE